MKIKKLEHFLDKVERQLLNRYFLINYLYVYLWMQNGINDETMQ